MTGTKAGINLEADIGWLKLLSRITAQPPVLLMMESVDLKRMYLSSPILVRWCATTLKNPTGNRSTGEIFRKLNIKRVSNDVKVSCEFKRLFIPAIYHIFSPGPRTDQILLYRLRVRSPFLKHDSRALMSHALACYFRQYYVTWWSTKKDWREIDHSLQMQVP